MIAPTIDVQQKIGPALHIGLVKRAKTLDLGVSVLGRKLSLDHVQGSKLPALSVAPYLLAAVLASIVCLFSFLYLASWRSSEGAAAQPWYLSLVEEVNRLLNDGDEQEDELSPETQGSDSVSADAELPQDVPTQIAALVGKNCQNFLDDGDDPAAKYAFDQLVWSRLSKEWQNNAVTRLEVCSPFKWQTPNVLSSMACAKGACGTDDVKFYVTRDGKVGIDVTEKGVCTQAFEDGFAPVELLCSR